MTDMTKICIVGPKTPEASSTFIRAHIRRLANVCSVVHWENGLPATISGPALSQQVGSRVFRKASRWLSNQPWNHEVTVGYRNVLRSERPDVVLAEYGVFGARVLNACKSEQIPLVVHFHGYDASVEPLIEKYRKEYTQVFQYASAIIAVSRVMQKKLISLGCDTDKVIYSPYGIDCDTFKDANPPASDPTFVAVGRLVEKKAPYLTILAFSKVLDQVPEARLRIIGDGRLMSVCEDVCIASGVSHAVDLLGAAPHDVVAEEMRNARGFLQHSVTAANGDSEGTPLAILEAGAMGLPVVSTRHAGIPDVVLEGETGFLVHERDVSTMSDRILRLAQSPELAGDLGRSAARRIRQYFTIEKSIANLSSILVVSANGGDISKCRRLIEASFNAPVVKDYQAT